MPRSASNPPAAYTIGQRARAFIRGLPDFEPLLSVAREGLEREGLGQDRRLNYALRLAESGNSSCATISALIRRLSPTSPSGPGSGYTYRTSPLQVPVPPHVQDRLCELYRKRYGEAMESHLDAARGAADAENASLLVAARRESRMEKAAEAYELLKSGTVNSPPARRHLAAVFCEAAQDVLAGGLLFNQSAERIREGIIREFGGERVRAAIPYGINAYEASRIIMAVSEALCGADMGPAPRRP
jgi:hypothetical protein